MADRRQSQNLHSFWPNDVDELVEAYIIARYTNSALSTDTVLSEEEQKRLDLLLQQLGSRIH
jgi:hypothetical protein